MTLTQTQKINILVLDDHALFRESIARLLDAEPDLRTVSECGSVEEALAHLADKSVDVVLLDLDLGEQRGNRFLADAAARGFAGRTLVVTAGAQMTEKDVLALMAQGAAGIFLKHHPPATLARAIRAIMNGEVWLEQRFLTALMRAASPAKPHSTDGKKLSERELAVLRGVMAGLANKQIADQIGVSESAVKGTVQQLFNKTGVRTRSQLVRIALEQYADLL
jgi:two-component system nitrate/nitrite response regulator NarL